jgi:hypothetical protein
MHRASSRGAKPAPPFAIECAIVLVQPIFSRMGSAAESSTEST